MTGLSSNQRDHLVWLVQAGGVLKDYQPGRKLRMWESLQKRGLVKLEAMAGTMDLSTLRITYHTFDLTITEAGRQQAALLSE